MPDPSSDRNNAGGPPTVTRLLNRYGLATMAIVQALSGCALGSASLCSSAGGTYTTGTCVRSSPGRSEAEERCQARGGVYLGGQERCIVSAGGA